MISCPVCRREPLFWLGLGTTWATSSGGPAIRRRKSARSFGVLCAILDALLNLLGHLQCRVAFTIFFLLRCHGSLWKSGLLTTLQQFALKTNDNFVFFVKCIAQTHQSEALGMQQVMIQNATIELVVPFLIFSKLYPICRWTIPGWTPLQQITTAIEEQIAVFFVSMGCNHSWSGFTFQICISSTLACYSSWTTMDVGRTRHWILKSFWGGWLYPIQRWCATSWFAVPFHPWHRHRFAVRFVFGSCDLLWKQWCGDSIIGITIHTFFQHSFLSDTNKR